MKRTVLFPVLLLLLAMFAGAASAQNYDLRLGATFASKHYVEGEFNERNPGLFLSAYREVGAFEMGAGAGAYKNSFSEEAFAVALRTRYEAHRYVEFGLDLRAVTGYGEMVDGSPAGTMPLVVPSVRVGPPVVRLAVMNIGGAVGFGFTLNLTELP